MWPSAVRTIHSARSSTWVASCSAISSTNSWCIGGTEPKLTPIRIGTSALFGLRDDLAHVFRLADVAGVEAQTVDAGVERLQRQRVLEVDVGDQRHGRVGHDVRQRRRRLAVGHGDADDLATGVGQLANLAQASPSGSRVSAVAIDWTTIGLSPPILTSPTWRTRVGRRGATSMWMELLGWDVGLREDGIAVDDAIDVEEPDHEHETDEDDQAREVDEALLFWRDLTPTAQDLEQHKHQTAAVERR